MGRKRYWMIFEKMAKTNLICQKTSPLRGVASFHFVPFGKLKKSYPLKPVVRIPVGEQRGFRGFA